AGKFERGVFDDIAGPQMAEPDAGAGLAEAVTVQHSLGTQAVDAAVAIDLEIEAHSLVEGPVIALTVTVAESPPSPWDEVVQALVMGVPVAITDSISPGS